MQIKFYATIFSCIKIIGKLLFQYFDGYEVNYFQNNYTTHLKPDTARVSQTRPTHYDVGLKDSHVLLGY